MCAKSIFINLSHAIWKYIFDVKENNIIMERNGTFGSPKQHLF